MTECPRCGGDKSTMALVRRAGSCSMEEIPCTLCNGVGSLTEEQRRLVEMGPTLRAARLMKYLTVRELAQKLGESPVVISAAEQGRVPLGRTIEDMVALQQRYLSAL